MTNRRRWWLVTGVLICMFSARSHCAADEQLESLEERAFREATALAAPAIVRIETVGGLDVVGTLLASSGPTTGVVVGADGWIITSAFNFANKPSSILVTTPDGRRHPAEVVGEDQARMLTLLKIDAGDLSPLPAAPLGEIAVGHWAIALGQTYDQNFPNVAVGIVSALDRVWGKAIQTDAKVSPANYGGPLVDVSGRGMGILVPLSPSESGETAGVEWYDSGIGFAIPLEDVYAVLERLQQGETLTPGLMGVGFADRSPISGAAVVDRVRPGSPADDAGLQKEDRIVEAESQPVHRVPHLRHILGRKYAGDELALKVERGDETLNMTLTLAAELTAYQRPLLGILPVRTALNPEAAGVEVRFVWPDSPAEAAELQRRDRIVAVNGTAIADRAALAEVVDHAEPEDVLALTVMRDVQELEREVTLTNFTGEIPEALPTAEIPAPEANLEAKTGRIVATLGGDEQRNYWAYVPQGYNSLHTYGLVIWMHPPGDTQEADVLKAWRSHCERRGIILAAPKTARPEGWTAESADFVKDLVAELQEQYAIDSNRIVMHAGRGAALPAAAIAFRERETFSGVSLISSPLPVPPPQTDPDAPLSFQFVFGTETAEAEDINRTAEALRQLSFPVTMSARDGTESVTVTSETAESIALWVDALDRL